MKRRVVLVIMDGWGLSDRDYGNAIRAAKTPNFERLWHTYPQAVFEVSGEAVGLPKGQMGTSEVNHLIIGAGRVMFQDLVRINNEVESGKFFKNKEFIGLMNKVKKQNSVLHLMGLVSDGGIHSHYSHLYALLKLAKDKGLKKVLIHAFTDGQDTVRGSGLGFVEDLEVYMKKLGVGEIASVSGRYYAMDRDNNWDRIDKAYRKLVERKGREVGSASLAVRESYEKKEVDDHIKPVLIKTSMGDEARMKKGDGAIFFNFRNDRTRQLMRRFLEKGPKGVDWVTMTQYQPDFPVGVAYSQVGLSNSLGEVLAKKKIKQLRVTETEKFAHLSFFLNCKREEAFEGEDRIMLDSSSDIKTHDERPEMRAPDIVKEIVQAMEEKTHEVIFTNICNCDIVGHTGNFKAAVKAVEVVDKAVAEIVRVGLKQGYEVLITADHGNAEEMRDEKIKETLTAHTTNPVPFILVSKRFKELKRDEGSLIDVAPTILKMMGIEQPEEMTGKSLV